jgi:glycolate oxidase iron-sulfur subunit
MDAEPPRLERPAPSGPLGLPDEALAGCVQCGLCLSQCPTWRLTGEEARSPRGRIDAMRDVQWRAMAADEDFAEVITSCVGCRACETACPSGVRYGELLETTLVALARPGAAAAIPRWKQAGLRLLGRPRLVRTGMLGLAVAQRLGLSSLTTARNLPRLPMRRPRLTSTGDDVVLLTGCVMDAVQREVHAAAMRVLGAAGIGVTVQPAGGCCGALARHAGLADLADEQVAALGAVLPPGVPLVSDSAGCGAALVEHGGDLAGRVVDVCTMLVSRPDRLPPPAPGARRPVVAVMDPCHLRHVQHADRAVHDLLGRYVEVVECDDDGLCCGAGGAHALLRPDEAAGIRARKLASLSRTGAKVVAAANPGCTLHLRAAGATVLHPVEVVDRMTRLGHLGAGDGDGGLADTGAGRAGNDAGREPGGDDGR